MPVIVRRLEANDDRSSFCSGDIDLDRFFQRYAGQNQFRHFVGTTYVAESDSRLLGFVTVSSGDIAAERIADKLCNSLPDYPIPILRIARLAVDRRFQGQGVGRLLLRTMLELALQLRDQAGCAGVVVDAKPAATAFYAGLGFQPLDTLSGELGERPAPLAMFLPIQLIAKAVACPHPG